MANQRFTLRAAVYIILIKNNQVFLLQRANSGFMDGFYGLPSGHIDGNEAATSAMQREAMEEIGIEVLPKDLQMVHFSHRNSSGLEYIDFYYTCNAWQGEPQNMEPEKCGDASWLDLNNLPETIVPYVAEAIDLAINKKQVYSEMGWQ